MSAKKSIAPVAAHAVILAAGQGTRMKSAKPKVLHAVGGTPMLGHVLAAAREAGVMHAHLVLGHGVETVRDWLATQAATADFDTAIAVQNEQLGTGHAVSQAMPAIPDTASVVVLYGDVPLVPADSIRAVLAAAGTGLALLTATVDNPQGYGRIVREPGNPGGRVTRIVEQTDTNAEQAAIREINTGIIAAPARRLKRWLSKVKNDNAKREFYLTDVIALAVKDGVEVTTVAAAAEEVEGVNDPLQLARMERRFQRRQAEVLQRAGLYLTDPARFDLRGTLTHGRDVFIDVGCVLEGAVTLGDGVRLGPYCVLRDVSLGAGTEVRAYSHLDAATVGEHCVVGPYARLRPGAVLGKRVHVGNFVEIKQSTLAADTKANHLAYVGDATVGARVNIGAGVITCNYDGVHKHRTIIGDDVFVGTDSQLVAPVSIGDGAYIAAGSTIAKDAPAGALTINRAREQKSFPGWKPAKRPG